MRTGRISIAAVVLLAVLGHVQQLEAATLTLAWDHSPDSHTTGYLISYGTKPGQYTSNVRTGYVTSHILSGLTDNTAYYFVVQAFDNEGTVGLVSSEVRGNTAPGAAAVTVNCPSPVLTSPDGRAMAVTLTPTVNGGLPPVTTTCSPASGSMFPVGSTSFSCSALDSLQRKASCTSSVVIMSPQSGGVVSPSGTAVPPASQIVDGQLVKWTLGPAVGGVPGHFMILRNGQQQGDYAASLFWYNGQIYANSQGSWFQWKANNFVNIGTARPGPVTPPAAAPAPIVPSPSGVALPPAAQILDSQLVKWTLGEAVPGVAGHFMILRNDQPQGDFANSLFWYNGKLFASSLGRWFEWTLHGFIDIGTTRPGPVGPAPPVSTPLVLSCPQIAPVLATNSSGMTVTFSNPTVSGGSSPVTVSCTPKSGSLFPIGTTAVSCQAADSMGNTASCSTAVTVRGPSGPALPVTPSPSSSGTAVPPAPQILDAQLNTWRLGPAVPGIAGHYMILRNDTAQGDYANSLLWLDGQLYAGSRGSWFQWTDGGFVDIGTTRPTVATAYAQGR